MKTISTEMGDYVIYHVSEAGNPDSHDTRSGEWFFEPSTNNDGVFSPGYATAEAAEEAALEWVSGEIAAQNADR